MQCHTKCDPQLCKNKSHSTQSIMLILQTHSYGSSVQKQICQDLHTQHATPNCPWQFPSLSQPRGKVTLCSTVCSPWGRKRPQCCTWRLQTPHAPTGHRLLAALLCHVLSGLMQHLAFFVFKHSPDQISINLFLWTRRKFSYPDSRPTCPLYRWRRQFKSFLTKLLYKNLINIPIFS